MKKQSLKKIAFCFALCSVLTFAGLFAFSNDIKCLHHSITTKIKKSVVHSTLDRIHVSLSNIITNFVSCGSLLGNSENVDLSTNPGLLGNIHATMKSSQRFLDNISADFHHLFISQHLIDLYEVHSKNFLQASLDYALAVNAPGRGLLNGQEKLMAKKMDQEAEALGEIFSKIIDNPKVIQPWLVISHNIQQGAQYYRLAYTLNEQRSIEAEEAAKNAVDSCNACFKIYDKYFREIKKSF